MATTTAPRRGNGGKGSGRDGDGPPRSFPSRQRKLGPAPIASFEDLSDDNDSSPPDPDLSKIKPMPEIREDGMRSPEDENMVSGLQFGKTTVIPGGSMVTSTSNPSGPTSGLQTPSTPRIDISCASSSTPPSEESNSEKELFPGGLGLAFHEEGTDDLRSSTEELEFGAEDEIHEGKKERREIVDDPFRRASHPANIFQRKVSLTPTDEDLLQRKPSAHSLYLEGFLSRPCRHSSFGSADRQRPGALSSLSNDGRRSASPNTMLLETSFCGNKPIPTPSMDLDSPPRDGKNGKSGGGGGGGEKSERKMGKSNTGMLSSDSSFESHKPQKLTATVQVHSHDNSIIHEQEGSGSKSSSYRKGNVNKNAQFSPDENVAGKSSGSVVGGGRSQPHLQSPDSPKSSDHWKPISPKPEKSSTSIISSPVHVESVGATTGQMSTSHVTKTPKVERKFFPDSFEAAMANSAPVIAKAAERAQEKARIEGGGRSSGRAARFMKEESMELIQKISLKSLGKKPAVEEEFPGSPGMRRKHEKPVAQEVCTRWPEPEVELIGNIVVGGQSVEGGGVKREDGGGDSRKKEVLEEEEVVVHEEEEMTTEMKFSEDGNISVEDVPIETKSFFQDSLDDEEDLPYVPTTLPLEKSVAIPILPIKERRKLGNLVETNPIQRPRCVRPPNPKALDDFIAAAASTGFPEESFADFSSISFHNSKAENCSSSTTTTTTTIATSKMKINLPREDSLPDPNNPHSPRPKSPKTKLPTSWADFAEMGLRSPREIRRQMRENNGDNSGSSPATPAAPTAIGVGLASTTDDVVSYQSDSCSEDIGAPPVHDNGASDEETESLLKLPKVPFAMDLDVHSNRSSVISQEVNSPSASVKNEIPEDIDEDDERLSCESP